MTQEAAASGRRPEITAREMCAEMVAEDLKTAQRHAVSKLAMEYMARLWSDRLPIVITRPFNYTGPGQTGHFLLPRIVDHFRRRTDEIELGNLDVWRDFSDVRAVAQAYRGLLEKRPAGQTFNICSGRLFSLREVLAMAEKITGHSMQVRVNLAFVRSNEVEKLCGDPGKLQALLGDWANPPPGGDVAVDVGGRVRC